MYDLTSLFRDPTRITCAFLTDPFPSGISLLGVESLAVLMLFA